MIRILHSIFEKDGEEWIADESSILTSNPPQYNCYRLLDGKHAYVFCHVVNEKFLRHANYDEEKVFPRFTYTSSGTFKI